MGKLSKWQIGLIAGVAIIVIGLAISLSIMLTQRGPSPETPAPSQPQETTTPEEARGTAPPTGEVPEEPQLEEIRFQGTYLRPGVQEGRYYFQVDEILAGPTPCQEEGLLVVVEPSHGQRYVLHKDDRLVVFGFYEQTGTACRVILRKPEQRMEAIPEPEPQPEKEQPRQPQPEVPAEQRAVRVQGHFTEVRGNVYLLTVDQVLQGQVPCNQLSVLVASPTVYLDQVNFRDEYEVYGLYSTSPTATPCTLTLAEPAHYIRLFQSAAQSGRTTPATPRASSPGLIAPQPGMPFFFSGGIALLQPLMLIKGSAGLTLGPQLRGMISAGMGQGEIDKENSRTGEEIPVQLQATAIEAALLYQISEKIYAGGSLGMIMLSGEYELPYPVQASKSFSETLPTAGLVAGFDLGYVMATGSVNLILGGGS